MTHPQGEKPKTELTNKDETLSVLQNHLNAVDWTEHSNYGVMDAMREAASEITDVLLSRHSAALAAKEESHKAEIEKLQAFKNYVHERLDKMGVPVNPDGEHSKRGCRIGDRLDIFEKQGKEFAEWASDNEWKFYKTTWSPARKDIWIKDGEQKTTDELFALFLSQGKKGGSGE